MGDRRFGHTLVTVGVPLADGGKQESRRLGKTETGDDSRGCGGGGECTFLVGGDVVRVRVFLRVTGATVRGLVADFDIPSCDCNARTQVVRTKIFFSSGRI